MSRLTDLTKKIVCAPLISLALVLGISSLLWQASLHQKMLAQVDAELHLTARTLDYLLQKKQPDPEYYCQKVSSFLEQSASNLQVALYTEAGKLVCLTGPKHAEQQASIPPPSNTEELYSFLSVDGTTQRSLLYPLSNGDGAGAYLSLGIDFSPFSSQLLRWRLVLLFSSILILAAAALYLRHPRRNQHSATLTKLAETIEQAGPDQRPEELLTDEAGSKELRRFIESHNQMAARMYTGIHRARQFAAHVAHELRTPLTILRGETEIALRSSRELNDIREVLASNLEEITRMSYLVDDLLTLSKSDLGEIPLQPKSIRLFDLLSDLQRQAQILAREKEITITMKCADNDAVIHADELRLRQALLNLLTNAIRYTPAQGVVSINAQTEETVATITVIDNGIGIDEKHLQHIFERFYRVDKKVHQYDGGTGLGLAIVKWVIDAHRGTIKVTSTPGQGSRFAITLPKEQNRHQ